MCFLWMHLVCLLIHLCSLDPLQLSPLSSPPPCTQRTKNESPVDSPGSPVLSQDGQATSFEVLSCYYCQNYGYSGRKGNIQTFDMLERFLDSLGKAGAMAWVPSWSPCVYWEPVH